MTTSIRRTAIMHNVTTLGWLKNNESKIRENDPDRYSNDDDEDDEDEDEDEDN
ncbi:hypothetical protein Pint_14587 [Pistacia integerrima]|uniref:Uncharacterized protein n=1 Tax=Pistacia integerrima TaxID=434235 RepID=A0ACC0YAB5_9ROSI|nr:hypothetical protein Pint_14587 [Pistacia integerrima]